MSDEQEQAPPKKQKVRDCPAGAPAWMVTYSDLVTLLLTFFVLLLSMASLDPVRFTEASSSLKDAFGIARDPAHVDFAIPVLPSPPISDFSPIQRQTTEKVYEKIKSQIDSLRLNDSVGVLKRDDESVVLRINDSVLFAPGQVKIAPQSYPVLRMVGDIIQPLPMDLRIEGHTDDSPQADSQLGSWDLSIERSISVLRFFTRSDLLPLDRMAAIGYGKQRPVRPNSDEASRALNRRVDFVLRLQSNLAVNKGGGRNDTIPL
jgi:chemotaxis protein MotB